MTGLLSYWPTQQEINRCIKTEAETASDAVLLAVHQETPLSIRNAGSTTKTPTSESDLLEAFLTKDLPEGTLLLAITGASGAGKSHMIRWLAAQLESDPRAENMHVIRIPKSANLKSVVELILDPLRDNDRFAKARKELEEAVASVNPADGAIHFAANLEVALREEAKAYESLIREDPGRTDKRDLMAKLDHARKLPNYFNDAALKEHFKGRVLPRIVQRAIVGRNQDEEEEKFPQFSIDDLKLPPENGLGEAAKDVQLYYRTNLNKWENDDGYKKAVEVLNSVVDKAIRNLFRLNQAMGGVTLEEIVLQIRTLLLEEGKELVLLIEDFAALSGIQEVLLSVCIQEAVRDGQLIRSPMRTALAVTDGYLASRDTILTRAKREWIVESNLPDEDDVIDRTTRLVGAYLNAARWGEFALTELFKLKQNNQDIGLTNWIEVYRDDNESAEVSDLLRAFGEDANRIPLFPFNANALGCLIDDHLRVAGKLQFNPRKVINHIIRDTLKLRETFEQKGFPPADFSARTPKADIAGWIARTKLSPSDRVRLQQTVVYWGGNPDDPNKLGALDPKLFEAFGLTAPTDLGVEPRPEPKAGPEHKPRPGPGSEPEPGPIPGRDPFVEGWRERLEKWVNGERLPQNPANEIRRAIVSALNRAIDWNAICMKPTPAKNTVIELPNALGNPSGQKRLVFAEDTKDSDGRLRKTLLAFLRYENRGESWTYPEADEDTVLIANAIEELVPDYLEIVSKQVAEEASMLASALARQGQVLGVAPKRAVGRQSIVNAIFSSAPEIEKASYPPESPQERWHKLKTEAAREREALQQLLASKIGAFQGSGSTVYAIDVARLSLSEAETFTSLDDLNPSQREHLGNLSLTRLRARSNALVREFSDLASLFQSLLGQDFDKQETYKRLKDLADSTEEAKVWPNNVPFKKPSLLNRLEEFRDAPLTEVLERMNALSEEASQDNFENILHILGRINFENVEKFRSLLDMFAIFIKELEGEVFLLEEKETGMTIEDLVEENKNTLNEIRSLFVSFQKDFTKS